MIHSFLLIGQSNMAGRGFYTDKVPQDSERLYVLRNGRWQPLFRPVNPDRKTAGVCLAESFARLYAEKFDVEVGLIPCADGGTGLNLWQPGKLLFDHAVMQAKLASRTSNIAGILWHQGEGDCDTFLYPTYEERFLPMMEGFRRELDLYDVPFLLGGLGDFLEYCPRAEKLQNYPFINEALQHIAATQPMTGFVSAKGLGSNEDKLHFSTDALLTFGERYFKEYLNVYDPHKVFPDKPLTEDAIRTAMEAL